MEKSQFQYKKSVFRIPIVVVIVLWAIYWYEIKFGANFNSLGVFPRTISGLKGIIFSPFIHSNTNHLFNNSIPLAVTLGCLLYFYQKIAKRVVVYGILLTGFSTWLIGRESYHIGASGVVYLLVSFLFFSGIIRKHYRLIALSLAIVFLYGSMVWYIFPVEDRISWEGHLSGFVIGIFFAFYFRKIGPQKEPFEYSKNPEFEKLFDENGNFVPPQENTENNNTQ